MKPDLRIFLCMLLATMMLACQRQGTANANLDKDEEHDLVVAQELSNTRVQCIAEDASGQLWIGTFRGLNRYDGHEYHQYFCTFDSLGLPDNQVQSLLCDKKDACGWPPSTASVAIPNRTILRVFRCKLVIAMPVSC